MGGVETYISWIRVCLASEREGEPTSQRPASFYVDKYLLLFTLLAGGGRGNHSGDQVERQRQRHGQLQLEQGGRCCACISQC